MADGMRSGVQRSMATAPKSSVADAASAASKTIAVCLVIVPRYSSMTAYCAGASSAAIRAGVRGLADRPTVRQVRGLAHPPPEPQAGRVDELEQLRHRIRPIAGIAQGVGERAVVGEVAGVPQQPTEGVSERQLAQRRNEVGQLGRRRAETEPAAVVLEHVHPGSAVAAVHHQGDRPARCEDGAQLTEADERIAEVVQDAGAHHVIEPFAELRRRPRWRGGAP